MLHSKGLHVSLKSTVIFSSAVLHTEFVIYPLIWNVITACVHLAWCFHWHRCFLICNLPSWLLFPGIKAVPTIQNEVNFFNRCERMPLSIMSDRKQTTGEDKPDSIHVNTGFTLCSIWMRWYKNGSTLRTFTEKLSVILWQLKCKSADTISKIYPAPPRW